MVGDHMMWNGLSGHQLFELLWYHTCVPLVLLQGVASATVIILLAVSAVRKGLRTRYLVYTYEIPLLVWYIYYWYRGAMAVTGGILNTLYHASAVSFCNFAIAPLLLEWRDLSTLSGWRRKPWSRGKILLTMLLISILAIIFLGYVQKRSMTNMHSIETIRREITSAPAKTSAHRTSETK